MSWSALHLLAHGRARPRAVRITALALLLGAITSTPLTAQKESAAGTPAPDRLWAAQTSPTLIRLAWSPAAGATAYRIFCAVGRGEPRFLRRLGPNVVTTLVAIAPGARDALHRCFIEAESAKGLASEKVAFNPVTPTAKGPAATDAPASVTAAETGEAEITLTWTEVPGATAYFIGRAVAPAGFKVLCQLCPTAPTYVDRDVTPGARHTYAVAAVLPNGSVSRRATSNSLTLGEDAGRDADAPGGPGGPDDGGGGDGGTGAGSGTPRASTPQSPTGATATLAASGSVRVAWTVAEGQADPVAYWIFRSVDGGDYSLAATVPGRVGQLDYAFEDTGAPLPRAGVNGGELRLGYGVQAINTTGRSPMIVSNAVTRRAEATGGGGSTMDPLPAKSCRLEYQRADNGWASEGRPDGFLGVEEITVASGERKVFVTDWKYEKSRNDGTNYYGSHLRVATNRGDRPVTLLIKGLPELSVRTVRSRAFVARALDVLRDGGYLFTFQPGDQANFRHDLMEVSCPTGK